MSADLLRAAADTLRADMLLATEVVEITDGSGCTTAYRDSVGNYFLDRKGGRFLEPRAHARETRTFHERIEPTLGRALADLLDWGHRNEAAGFTVPVDLLSLARLIVGEPS